MSQLSTQDGNINSIDINLPEIAYNNDEMVNFESAVNIHSSSDVIVGPVTQFHVNGNLTIVQNRKKDDVNKDIQEQNDNENDKFLKIEKSTTKNQNSICTSYQRVIPLTLLIIFGIMTILMISLKTNSIREHQDKNEHFCLNNFEYDSILNKEGRYQSEDDTVDKTEKPVIHHVVHNIGTFSIITIIWVVVFITFGIAIIIVTILKFNLYRETYFKPSFKKNSSFDSSIKEEIPSKKDILVNDANDSTKIENHMVYSKRDWFGYAAKHCEKITSPVRLVVIKHIGAGKIEDNFNLSSRRLITIQSENMAKGMPDIYCSFFISGDGSIYVGRGWDVQPEFKKNTIDIVFSGNFDVFDPPEIMIDTAQALIREGVKRNKIAPDYLVVPHSQTVSTRSPGINLIDNMKSWPHYSDKLFFHGNLP